MVTFQLQEASHGGASPWYFEAHLQCNAEPNLTGKKTKTTAQRSNPFKKHQTWHWHHEWWKPDWLRFGIFISFFISWKSYYMMFVHSVWVFFVDFLPIFVDHSTKNQAPPNFKYKSKIEDLKKSEGFSSWLFMALRGKTEHETHCPRPSRWG